MVIPIYNARVDAPDPGIAKLCQSWQTVPNPDWTSFDPPSQDVIKIVGNEQNIPREWRWCSAAWRKKIKKAIHAVNPDLVFVFRFYLAPYVLPNIGALALLARIWTSLNRVRERAWREFTHCAVKRDFALEMEQEAQGLCEARVAIFGTF